MFAGDSLRGARAQDAKTRSSEERSDDEQGTYLCICLSSLCSWLSLSKLRLFSLTQSRQWRPGRTRSGTAHKEYVEGDRRAAILINDRCAAPVSWIPCLSQTRSQVERSPIRTWPVSASAQKRNQAYGPHVLCFPIANLRNL